MKRKTIRIAFSVLLVVCAVWIAVPKVYIHQLLGHNHGLITNPLDNSVQQQVKDDCEFDKYDSPVYFTIFKFINNLLPVRSREQSYIQKSFQPYSTYKGCYPALRAPPAV